MPGKVYKGGSIFLAAPLGTMTRANRAVNTGVTGSSFPALPEGDTALSIGRVSRPQGEYGLRGRGRKTLLFLLDNSVLAGGTQAC